MDNIKGLVADLSLNEIRELREWLDAEVIPAKREAAQQEAVAAMAIEWMREQGALPEPGVWKQPTNLYEGYIAGDLVEHEGEEYRCVGVDLNLANPVTGLGWRKAD